MLSSPSNELIVAKNSQSYGLSVMAWVELSNVGTKTIVVSEPTNSQSYGLSVMAGLELSHVVSTG